jgi:hypothetical protein
MGYWTGNGIPERRYHLIQGIGQFIHAPQGVHRGAWMNYPWTLPNKLLQILVDAYLSPTRNRRLLLEKIYFLLNRQENEETLATYFLGDVTDIIVAAIQHGDTALLRTLLESHAWADGISLHTLGIDVDQVEDALEQYLDSHRDTRESDRVADLVARMI